MQFAGQREQHPLGERAVPPHVVRVREGVQVRQSEARGPEQVRQDEEQGWQAVVVGKWEVGQPGAQVDSPVWESGG